MVLYISLKQIKIMKTKITIIVFSFLLALFSVTLYMLKLDKVTLTAMPKGEDFIISTTQGEFDLSKKRGKVIILYFGYTFCPDICPTTLSTIAESLKKFTSEESENIETLIIGVDTKRDTLEKLQEYTAFFHPSIKGGVASDKMTREIAKSFGVNYMIKEPAPGKDYYVVDHSTQLIILNKQGKIAEYIPHGETSQYIYQTVLRYLEEK